MSAVLNQPVVIDNGTGIIKAGFAGADKPKVPPAVFGYTYTTAVYLSLLTLLTILFLYEPRCCIEEAPRWCRDYCSTDIVEAGDISFPNNVPYSSSTDTVCNGDCLHGTLSVLCVEE